MKAPNKFKQFIQRSAIAFSLLLVIGLAAPQLAQLIQQQQEADFAAQNEDSWGSEVLAEVGQGLEKISPIVPANACGLGASSCFRCHNGQRAAEPTRSENITWHIDHDKVNHSCVGCHNGNPRILKQNLAHRNLIANPLSEPEKSCTSCHSADEVKDKLAKYAGQHPSFTKE